MASTSVLALRRRLLLEHPHVRTLLNSGYVVFTARANAVRTAPDRIQRALLDRLGVSSKVTVLTAAELGAILDENPLAGLCDTAACREKRFLLWCGRQASETSPA